MSSAAERTPPADGRRGPQRVFRQRTAVGSCVVGVLVLAVIVAGGAAKGGLDLVDLLWSALVLSVLWMLFMRPAVVLDEVGITLRNVAANIHIPWGAVGGTEQRWNLVVWTERDGQSYTAWAISSSRERPEGVRGGFDNAGIIGLQ